jgi:hypothetical protein
VASSEVEVGWAVSPGILTQSSRSTSPQQLDITNGSGTQVWFHETSGVAESRYREIRMANDLLNGMDHTFI